MYKQINVKNGKQKCFYRIIVSKEQLKQKMSRHKQVKKIYIETKHRNET